MLTNAEATVYHRVRDNLGDIWEKKYLPAVWWHEGIAAGITTNGIKTANGLTNVLTVRIPDISVEVTTGDYIVAGNCKIDMETVKDLKGEDYFCVTGANYNRFGNNPHIKVVAQ